MAKKAKERKKRTRYVFIDLDELDRSHDFNKAKVIEAGGFTELQARSYAQIKCGFYLKDWRFRPIPKALFEVMKEKPTPHYLENVPEFAKPREVAMKKKPKAQRPDPRFPIITEADDARERASLVVEDEERILVDSKLQAQLLVLMIEAARPIVKKTLRNVYNYEEETIERITDFVSDELLRAWLGAVQRTARDNASLQLGSCLQPLTAIKDESCRQQWDEVYHSLDRRGFSRSHTENIMTAFRTLLLLHLSSGAIKLPGRLQLIQNGHVIHVKRCVENPS